MRRRGWDLLPEGELQVEPLRRRYLRESLGNFFGRFHGGTKLTLSGSSVDLDTSPRKTQRHLISPFVRRNPPLIRPDLVTGRTEKDQTEGWRDVDGVGGRGAGVRRSTSEKETRPKTGSSLRTSVSSVPSVLRRDTYDTLDMRPGDTGLRMEHV